LNYGGHFFPRFDQNVSDGQMLGEDFIGLPQDSRALADANQSLKQDNGLKQRLDWNGPPNEPAGVGQHF
jgi:hypothetical protein